MTFEELHKILDDENRELSIRELKQVIYELKQDCFEQTNKLLNETANGDIEREDYLHKNGFYQGEQNAFQIALDLLEHFGDKRSEEVGKTLELKQLRGNHILKGIELSTVEYDDGYHGKENVDCIKFNLDGITYIAVEDPSDGYRSYCRELQVTDEPCKTTLPDIEVVCVYRDSGVGYYSDCDILEFIDSKNGKTILMVGTNNTDDYYPFCVFEYTPENMFINENKGE